MWREFTAGADWSRHWHRLEHSDGETGEHQQNDDPADRHGDHRYLKPDVRRFPWFSLVPVAVWLQGT